MKNTDYLIDCEVRAALVDLSTRASLTPQQMVHVRTELRHMGLAGLELGLRHRDEAHREIAAAFGNRRSGDAKPFYDAQVGR